IAWRHGTCLRCKTARELAGVAFASGRDVWAYGYNPPGETGAGDSTVLRSRDGGVTWRELGWTYRHNELPRASFASAREGWIVAPDPAQGDAELRWMYARDGMTLRREPTPDFFTRAIQYLGGGVGF